MAFNQYVRYSTQPRRIARGWTIAAPAKLNFSLDLLGKRPDGYHELESVMAPISLFDHLILDDTRHATAGSLELNCEMFPTGEPPATDPTNLVWRAVEALRAATGFRQRPVLRLLKRIPAQAGLGGGSSDGAATLTLLNRAYGLGLCRHRLSEIAATLGSDVPFFVEPCAAIAAGRGEKLARFSIHTSTWLVVLKPNFGLSTADVYRRAIVGNSPPLSNRIAAALVDGDVRWLEQLISNDLQDPAVALRPEIAEHLWLLSQAGCVGAMMTGSGSATFGICRNQAAATRIGRSLRRSFSGSVFVCRTLAGTE